MGAYRLVLVMSLMFLLAACNGDEESAADKKAREEREAENKRACVEPKLEGDTSLQITADDVMNANPRKFSMKARPGDDAKKNVVKGNIEVKPGKFGTVVQVTPGVFEYKVDSAKVAGTRSTTGTVSDELVMSAESSCGKPNDVIVRVDIQKPILKGQLSPSLSDPALGRAATPGQVQPAGFAMTPPGNQVSFNPNDGTAHITPPADASM